MDKGHQKSFSWDFYSKLILTSFSVLQVLRWRVFPQFMDIHYHLLTAWGFIQAGGYSGWDFWQYAPVGRIHIYPPFFHLILAFLIKLGINKIILAKVFETIIPVLFLVVLWNFIRKNYDERLGFFVMLTASSSFSFYLSLAKYLPATLAIIFGLLALGQLFQNRYLRTVLLLVLCFYTHIGISWFFAFILLFYGLFNKEYRKLCFRVFICAFILSLPILFKQLTGLKVISKLGLNLNEKYSCQFKIIDYILAFFGLILTFKGDKKYRLFLSIFLASLIFLLYPYRFFSAEGFLPIILLCAVSLDALCQELKRKKVYLKYLPILVSLFILFFSPTLSMDKPIEQDKPIYKINLSDSAFMGMLLARGQTLWFPKEYISSAALIKNNSSDNDIIYSSLIIVGVTLASISGRATANALLPEIESSRQFDPFRVSQIIIFLQDDDRNLLNRIVSSYKLIKIGENKLFILYKNPACHVKVDIKKAALSFGWIAFIGLVPILLLIPI